MHTSATNLPLISIVMPVRNAASTLVECLESIESQTLDRFELVAIDDDSSDGSTELLESHARRDRRIRVLRPGRIGLVAALNLGIGEARAPLIARMDADDVMLPNRIEEQFKALSVDSNLTVVGSAVELLSDGEVLAGYREYVRWQNGVCTPAQIAENIYVESPFAHPSVMFRRDLVRDAGGYRDGDFPEDYELWLRLHARGERLGKVPEVLLRWRDHAGRTSRVDPRYSRDAFDRLRARYLAGDSRMHDRQVVVWGSGRRTRLRVRHLLQQGVRLEAYIDIDPLKVGRSVGEVPRHSREWLRGRGDFVLIYIASHGAREEISAYLESIDLQRGVDFLAVG